MQSKTVLQILDNVALRYWRLWTTPRSNNRDEAFREDTIRVTSGALIVILLLAFIIQIALFPGPISLISFPILILLSLLISLASAYAVHRGRILYAGYLLTGVFLAVSTMLVLFYGVNSATPMPTLMLTVIMATLVLPRKTLLPITILCLVLVALITALQGSVLPTPIVQPVPQSILVVGGAFFLGLALIYLRQLRVEFDNRLAAVTASLIETERAKSEAEHARQEADRANNAKSQFLANMSHELRTPLNAIIGFNELMLAGMAGEFTEKQTKLQGYIDENARRLLVLINDILNLAKVESGKIGLHAGPASPRKVIGDLVILNQSLAQKKGITLEATFAEDMPEAVLCDVQKVQQIVTNLISNAVKFTDKGGVEVKVGTSDKNNWVIKVVDTGMGMSADAAPYIFEKFVQLDNTATRQHQGTGLGLAIVKAYIDSISGTISVDTQLGKGTTFAVTLPRVMGPVSTPQEKEATGPVEPAMMA